MTDHLDRLKAMSDPGQQKWDLSPKDEAAIRWAIDEIDRLTSELREVARRLYGGERDERTLSEIMSPWLEEAEQ